MPDPHTPAPPLRRTVANLARCYRAGSLPYEQFLRQLPRNADREDPAIADLLDLIVEASSRTGQASEDASELWRLIDQKVDDLLGEAAAANARP
jgi:hypothetical protein